MKNPAMGEMVSCILPTKARPDYLAQSLRFFQQQDYPDRELVVIYDEPADLPGDPPADERISYLQAEPGASIGAKRQLGNGSAKGAFIAQWDDDDVFAPTRLSRQLQPILNDTADISGLTNTHFFDLKEWQFWGCSNGLHARMFFRDVAAGTLVYRTSLWRDGCHYADISLREDADFLDRALSRGARLIRIAGQDLFLYLRHGANSWSFQTGILEDPKQWYLLDEPDWIWSLRPFYRKMRTRRSLRRAERRPMVSCIMPTRDRPDFVPAAIDAFLAQDYPNRELVIVDDGEQPLRDLVPDHPTIRYIYLDHRQKLGVKRNLACAAAAGSLIAHWDDDDYYAPNWLSFSIASLLAAKADVCGLGSMLFYQTQTDSAWLYVYPRKERPWVGGATMLYRKDVWRRNRFPDVNVGEDNSFLWQGDLKHVVDHGRSDLFVASIHENNTSTRLTRDPRWRPFDSDLARSLTIPNSNLFKGRQP